MWQSLIKAWDNKRVDPWGDTRTLTQLYHFAK